MDQELYTCGKCKLEKPVEEFYKNKRPGKRPVTSECKMCAAIRSKYWHDNKNKSNPNYIPMLERKTVKKDEEGNIVGKTCSRCRRYKLCSEFYTRVMDGITCPSTYCKICSAEDGHSRKDKNYLVHIYNKYGVNAEQYYEMVDRQKGLCLICGIKPDKCLHLDHCHSTGKVRGLLCMSCNHGIGNLRDDISVLENAIRYLRGLL